MTKKDLQRAKEIEEALKNVNSAIEYTRNNFLVSCNVTYVVNNAKQGRLEIDKEIQKDFTIVMHKFLKGKKAALESELKSL